VSEDTYPNAGRASGYTDNAGNDVGENIINRVTGLVSTIETKLLLNITKTEAQLNAIIDAQNAIISTQDRRFEYMLGQMAAHYDKEDTRHDALHVEKERDEKTTLAALTSVARRLDEITAYVQQSVTLAREGIAIGKEARATGIEALAIAKAGAARLGKVEKAITTLKKGQAVSDRSLASVIARLDQLGVLAEKTNILAEEHNRLASEQNRLSAIANDLTAEHAALARDVAELKAWRETLEARGDGK
jgi:hypothetical protein